MRPDELDSAVEARALLYAPLVSRALCSVVELGVPDLLASEPRTAAELAGLTGAHEPSLRQVMTALTAFDVFAAHADDRFALARIGSALVSDAPGSAAASALMALEMTGRAWNGIPGTVRTGVPAFETEFGADFFGHLDGRSDLRTVFDRTQAADLDLEIAAILGVYDFSGTRTLVDVGGGDGALLARLLDTYPQLHGVLVDRPNAVAAAGVRLKEAGFAARADLRTGDFFQDVPEGGDVYLLREILHDWDDDRCVDLLRVCRRAMPEEGRLIVIELAADDTTGGGPQARMTALMSLYMLSVLPGRERTTREFAALLSEAGLRLDATYRLTGQKVLIEASADPEAGPSGSGAGRERD
ncbi:methyltransferase [Streptomyces sp. NPDC012510]|uniref:methyltransferase n=1 Tax=Streptomyces sp. NPDC012510 TaxID=3364838 RepID=UPI0036E39A02